jgi:diguanylate cyclase (GGDEF)-like protein/PAS domain S-box-containing protein
VREVIVIMKKEDNNGNDTVSPDAGAHHAASVPAPDETDQIEKKLINQMNDGVFIAQEGRFVYANPALVNMLEYPPDEFVGSYFESVVAPEFMELWQARYKLRVENGVEPPARYEVQFLHRDGKQRIWLDLQAKRIQFNNSTAVFGVVRDISRYKKLQSELEKLSRIDELTGLVNRSRLIDLLVLAIKSARRRQEKLAVMFLDIDGFKQVNDTLGHDAGDHLLKEISVRLQMLVRDNDIVGRIYGDEFVLVLKAIRNYSASEFIAQKIIQQISSPIQYNEHRMEVSASVGICHYPDDGNDYSMLLKAADTAMYRAKQSGKNCYRLYSSGEPSPTQDVSQSSSLSG